MQIGSLVRDKIWNKIGIVICAFEGELWVHWNCGDTFWCQERNVEVICK
jgi:hypothetical protein